MTGSWHRYRAGEPWRLPQRRATVVLRTSSAVAVCFDCPTVELLTDVGLARSKALTTLGPDLLAPDFDVSVAVANLRRHEEAAIGEALLDQRALAGIGNVVRNEALFMERIHPWLRVGDIEAADLERLVISAQRVLRSATSGGARTTTGVPLRGARAAPAVVAARASSSGARASSPASHTGAPPANGRLSARWATARGDG